MRNAGSSFLAGGAPGHGEAAPGDHLQTAYHLWLVGDQLEHGHVPWRDPYSFRPESGPQPNYPGWPFGLVFWPLSALFGLVRGWNALVLLGYVAAGGCTCLWLRELGLPRAAALAGGLAFAIAPYRAAQSTGHLLGPISILLPLALYAIEKESFVLTVAAVVSIPLSGQVHLALGAVPFVCAYALVRRRDFRTIVTVEATVAAAVAAGFLVKVTTIDRSHLKSGRSLHAVSQYAAHWGDFVSRHKGHQAEQFVFLGWATPVLALIGLVLLWRRRRGLALVLALGAAVPILLALGTHTPLYSPLWHALPPLHYPRVPERLLRGWKSHGPGLRSQVLGVLLGRAEWAKAVLAALEEKQVPVFEIDAARRQLLLISQMAPKGHVRSDCKRIVNGTCVLHGDGCKNGSSKSHGKQDRKAQRRFVHGTVTTNSIVTKRKPLLLTDCSLLERSLSRQCPRLLILRPQRRSKVSSMTISTLPPAVTKLLTKTCNSCRLTCKEDQRARLST